MADTAYNAYVRADALHGLQRSVTETDGERSFLVVCQVQELWFGLVVHDLRCAIGQLDADRLPGAGATLARAASHFHGLNASWRSLSGMRPADFQVIKTGLTREHGRSSSLQSWKFREMLFLLGLKDPGLLAPVEPMPAEHRQLLATLHEPDVYGATLAAARRAGFAVPERTRPATKPDPGVVAFWSRVLAAPDTARELNDLADVLLQLAEGLAEYRHLHYLATRRTLGGRAGFYGTSGVDWLAATLTEVAFPDLWATTLPDEERT